MKLDDSRPAACAEIHEILSNLPIFNDPEEVPFTNGLYFFYEDGEKTTHDNMPGIVRVGNHPRSQGRLRAVSYTHLTLPTTPYV